jgi:hypothetical protein
LHDRESLQQFAEEFKKLTLQHPKPCLYNIGSEEAFSNYSTYGKKEILSFITLNGRDNKYCHASGQNEGAFYDCYASLP